MGAFKAGGNLEEEVFVGDGTEELEAYGKLIGSETARDRYRGDSGKICGAVVAKQQGASGMIGVADSNGLLADFRRRDRRGGIDEGIDFCDLEGEMKLLDEFLAKLERGEIGRGGHFRADGQTGRDIFAVVCDARGEPAGLLMVMGGLGPGDLASGVLGFLEQWDCYFLEFRSLFIQCADRSIKKEVNLFGHNFLKE